MTRPAEPQSSVRGEGIIKRFRARGGGWFSRATNTVLHGVDIDIAVGEVVGVVGESGSGKTTLGKCLLRIHQLNGGSLFYRDESVGQLSSREFRAWRRRYQMVYQNPAACLNPALTVEQHLAETASVHLGLKGAELNDRIDDVLGRFRLYGKRGSLPSQLSGGEKRRVSLARCLLPEPYFLVADEPTAGLDASVKAAALELMIDQRGDDLSYLFISHELATIRYVSDRIIVMFHGRIIEEMPVGSLDPSGGTHHPYTLELFKADLSQRPGRTEDSSGGVRLATDDWTPPPDTGCSYRHRCARFEPQTPLGRRCASEQPALIQIGGPHRIACHLAG